MMKNYQKLANPFSSYRANGFIFLDATKSVATDFRWQTFNGNDLRFFEILSGKLSINNN